MSCMAEFEESLFKDNKFFGDPLQKNPFVEGVQGKSYEESRMAWPNLANYMMPFAGGRKANAGWKEGK